MATILIVEKDWRAINGEKMIGDDGYVAIVKPGRREMERIPNPRPFLKPPWLVLKGTKIGMAEHVLREIAATAGSGVTIKEINEAP